MKRHATDEPGHEHSAKKAKGQKDSPDTIDEGLLPGAPLDPAGETPSGEIADTAPNQEDPTDSSEPDTSSTAIDKVSPPKDAATSSAGTAAPQTSPPLIGIPYFQTCIQWVEGLDFDDFKFAGARARTKLKETLIVDGKEETKDAKVLIQGYLSADGFNSLEEVNRFGDNPDAKATYGCKLYLMQAEEDALRTLYQHGPLRGNLEGSITLKQGALVLAGAPTLRPGWDVHKDGFPFLYDGSQYAGQETDQLPLLMPTDFNTGDLVVAEFTVQGWKMGSREGYSLGLCSLYRIEPGTGTLPGNVGGATSQDTLFAAETPRRVRAPRPVS